jgi:excisionase family DNA binding protein
VTAVGWVTKDVVAEHLGVSHATIDRLVTKGLPSAKLANGRQGARRFKLDEVDAWVRENGKEAAA